MLITTKKAQKNLELQKTVLDLFSNLKNKNN